MYDHRVLTGVNTPRLQSLLAYLLLHREAPQARRYLAFLFWPDSSEAQARTNLRKLFHQLHQALPEADRFLQADVHSLQWRNDAPFSLDVADFERAVAQPGSLQNLQTAADLYFGDLLPNCYDDWIFPERERLRQMYAETLERLINLFEGERNHRAAISYAQRLLRLDPLCELTYRDLLRLHAMSGDRAGMVRVYQTCVTVLRRELDVEPSMETQEAYERGLKMAEGIRLAAVSQPRLQPTPGLNNLPLPLTRFIGREHEVELVKGLVLSNRLVTLAGAGGIGKTRLALVAARALTASFMDGIWHVDLAALSDPSLVLATVASVLGVREERDRPLLARVTEYLREKQMLLILDKCEHLIEAVQSLVEALLSVASEVHILVTSRVVLGMTGEVIWRVPSLPTPDMSQRTLQEEGAGSGRELEEILGQYTSVQLFVDRAAAVLPTFALANTNVHAVGRICQQLDGIPLALELAAALVRLLTVQEIADHLQDALQILSHGRSTALPRHRTLQATLDWSHVLLRPQEQALFRRLACFAGSFTLEAAEFICSSADFEPAQVLNGLAALVDQSLVSVEAAGEATRFRLHEVTRQYARARLLEAGEEEQIRNRHLEFFCKMVESLEADLHGTLPPGAFEHLTQEYDNLCAALEWSGYQAGNILLGLRLAATLTDFWELRGQLTAERGWLEALLRRAGEAAEPTLRAKALRGAGKVAYYQCDFEAARMYFEQSLALDRELNNRLRMADTLSRLGFLFVIQENYTAAEPVYRESLALFRALEDRRGVGRVLSELGYIALRREDYIQARAQLEESLTLFSEPDDRYLECRARHFLGHVARLSGDYAQARAHYKRACLILTEMHNTWGLFYLIEAFACLAVAEAQWERAVRLFGAAEHLGEMIGAVMAPIERAECERNTSAARAALSEGAFSAAWAVGQAMSLDEVISYMLEQPQ
ncbi:MAG: TPR repeat:Bacterial transcriptional activator domain:Tetratricopeptide TPR_4 [Anaerolineae bacterium]|nr:MAG: TPR repeat:Bacterial transcriptional activator domain:Tetratricopeptide TPR_4 [Anaerolineae bacterium]